VGEDNYREHTPSPALRGAVACFWTRTSAGGAQRVLPDGCMDILFHRGGDGWQGSVVGAMTHALVTGGAPTAFVGVRFQPGEACRFLAFAASETTDRVVALDDIWGAVARDVAGVLDDAGDTAERIRVLDAALLRRLPAASPADFRVRRAVRAIHAGAPSVAHVAAHLDLSPRQLHRLFDERVGIGPKVLARVFRLQRAIFARREGDRSWASIAAGAGYADQAHLVRECRDLAGVAPTELGLAVSDSFNPEAAAANTSRA
jgi:AraC-like DNA-binding protein